MTPEHYFSADPAGETITREVEFAAAGRTFRVTAAGGVFSAGRLDPGTAVLLRRAPLPAAGTLLDLGCGYGPIALALAASAPAATVYAVDVNRRALDLAARNARAHGLDVVTAEPDEVPPDVRFTEIWSNPPIRIGKPALHGLLARWLDRLTPDGTAWLVVARNLGSDSLQVWLTEEGWPTDRHASAKGFRILRVRSRGTDGQNP